MAAIAYKEINELAEELESCIAAGEAPLVVVMDSVTDIRTSVPLPGVRSVPERRR